MTDTTSRIETILRHQSGVGDSFSFHNETTLRGDLDLDSLDLIEVAMLVETEFAIDIPDDDVDSAAMGTLGGLTAYVRGKLDARAAARTVPELPTVINV